MAELMPPSGFFGPTLGGGHGDYLSELLTNAGVDTLLAGELVRASGNLSVVRAQADILANAIGLLGAMRFNTVAGGRGQVATNGRAFVLLEAALAPAAGDPLFLSATVAGRGTTAVPAIPIYLGIVKDASIYAATGGVIADLVPSALAAIVTPTLSDAYNYGAAAADQTMVLTDAHGGGIIVDATDAGFTGVAAFTISSPGGGNTQALTNGNLQVVKSQNAGTNIDITNLTAGASAQASLTATSNAGGVVLGMYSTLTTPYGAILAASAYIYTSSPAGFSIIADAPNTQIRLAAGGNVAGVTLSSSQLTVGVGLALTGTDVNVAGPYAVLATDFFLEVRRTATAPITINMPSIATVGSGHIVAIMDSGYNAAVNNITVAPNGADSINGVAANYTMGVSGSCLWFKANTTTANWELV